MPYTNSISLALGSSKANITLIAQLFDTLGSNVGSTITTGFVEIGQGNYLWTYNSFPDGFRGGVKFFNVAFPSVVLASTSVNPEEIEIVENINNKVSAIESVIDDLTNPPKEITIEVPQISTKCKNIEITTNIANTPSIEIVTGVGL